MSRFKGAASAAPNNWKSVGLHDAANPEQDPMPVTLYSSGGVEALGEAHLGEFGGNSETITPAITVSTTPAYSAGDSIGGKITLASALRAAGHNVTLGDVMLLDRSNQKPVGTLLIFGADPAAATITDNAAFVFSTDDLKCIAAIPVASTDWITINSKAVANLANLARGLKAASGTSLYAAFVVTNTPTFAATTDLQIAFKLYRD